MYGNKIPSWFRSRVNIVEKTMANPLWLAMRSPGVRNNTHFGIVWGTSVCSVRLGLCRSVWLPCLHFDVHVICVK